MKIFKFKRKPREVDVDKQDKKLIDDLTKQRNDARKFAKSIDAEIIIVQKSTRTLMPFMTKPHNYLRMKYRWYYNWHLKPYARNVHWGILGLSVTAIMLGTFFSVYVPNPTERTVGATGCTTTKTGSWNDATVWTGCSSSPPGINDEVIIANNVTLNASATINSLTINNGITLDTSGTPTLDLGGQAPMNPDFTNNGTFTPGSSTVVLEPAMGVNLTAGAITFNNLSITPAIFMADTTATFGSGAIIVNNNFVVSATKSSSVGGIKTLTVNMGAAIAVTGTTQITKTGNYAATKLDTTSANHYTLATGSLAIDGGGTLTANSSTINIVNTLTKGGTFTYGTSTLNFTGTGTSQVLPATTYYNLKISGSGSWGCTSMGGTITMNGTLTVDTGTYNNGMGCATVVNGDVVGTGTINVAGNFTMAIGTAIDRSLGTVGNSNTWNLGGPIGVFSITNSTGSTRTVNKLSTNNVGVGALTLGTNVVLNITSNSTETWTVAGADLTSGNAVTIGVGSSINPGNSTFLVTVTASLVTTVGINPATFYNLTLNPTSASTSPFVFGNGTAGGMCFLPGTQISTPSGLKNIEDIQKGDWVYSYENNKVVIRQVTATSSRTSEDYLKINNKVNTTSDQIFYLTNGAQQVASDLKVGDVLKTQSGEEIVKTISMIQSQVIVYDITVEDTHNYFADGYMVHNAGSPVVVQNNLTISKGGAGATTLTTDGTNVSSYSFKNLQIDLGNTFTVGTTGGSPVPLTITGNFTNNGTFTHSSGTVTFAGTSGIQQINMGGTGAGQKFKNIVVSNSGTSVQLVTNNMTMDTSGTIAMTAGTLDLNGQTLTLASSPTLTAGTIAIGTGTLSGASYNLTVNSGGTVTQGIGTANLTNLTVGSGGTYTCTGNSTINIAGNLSINANANWTAGTSTITTSGTSKDIGAGQPLYNLTTGGGTQNISTALDINGNFINGVVLTASGGITSMSVAGNFTNNSTMPSNFTFTFDGADPATQTLKLGVYTGTLIHSGTGTLQLSTTALALTGGITNSAGTLDTAGIQMTLTGDLTMNGGTLSNSTGTVNITVNGNVTGTTGIINLANGTLTQRIGAAKNFGSTSGSSDWTFNNLTFTNSSTGDLAVTANTEGSGKIITTGTLTIGSASDTNFTTFDCATNNRTVDAAGITITSKGAFSAPTTLTVSGNYANSGTFTPGTGTVIFDGNTTISGSATNTFYNITISGVLNAPSANIDITNNWSNTGTFNPGTGTITFRGVTTSIISGNTSFYNLTIDTTADGAKTMSFDAGSTQTITHALILNGSNDNELTLERNNGSGNDQYMFVIPRNMTSGDFINVSNNKVNGNYYVTVGNSVVDGGNNTNWIFPVDETLTPTITPTPTPTDNSSPTPVTDIVSPKIGIVAMPGSSVQIVINPTTPQPSNKKLVKYEGIILIKNAFDRVVDAVPENDTTSVSSAKLTSGPVYSWNYPWWRVGLFKADVDTGGGPNTTESVTFIIIPLWIWIFLAITSILGVIRTINALRRGNHPSSIYHKFFQKERK